MQKEKTQLNQAMISRKEDLIRCLLLVCISGGLWGMLFIGGHRSIIYPDAMEYSQIARSLVEGRGAVTDTIWTLRTAYPLQLPPPDVRRPLLWPFIISLFYHVFGVSDGVTILASGFLGCLSTILLYLLARRFLPTIGSFLVALVFCFQPHVILMNQSGLSEPLFTTLFLLICLVGVNAERRWQFFLIGLIIGLSQWVRLNGFLLLIPPVVWILWKREKDWKACFGMLILGAALLLLPAAIRNYKHLGMFSIVGIAKFSIVGEIPPFPDHGAERALDKISVFSIFASNPIILVNKVIRGLGRNMTALFGVAHPLLWGLFLVPILNPSENRKWYRLGLYTLSILLLLWLTFSTGEFEGSRFYEPLVPLLVLGGLIPVLKLTKRSGSCGETPNRASTIGLSVIMIILILPGAFHIHQSAANPPQSNYGEQLGALLQHYIPPGAVVGSDVPWAVGWYGRRLSIWLPLNTDGMEELNRRIKVDYVVLTTAAAVREDWRDTPWPQVYKSRDNLTGYRLVFPEEGYGPLLIFKKI